MSTSESPPPSIEFAPPSALGRGVQLRALAELLRLPNVFTAIADILLGFLFTHEGFEPWPALALLVAGSAAIYSAGMALNDYFDQRQDAEQRPGRPIPSGRISAAGAGRIGAGLLIAGVLSGCAAGLLAGQWRPALVAVALAGMVLVYDGLLKRTPLAPLAMGSCRFLNVLLGMSVAAEPWGMVHWVVAGGVGLYIVGVTWFARTEAATSSRLQLAAATAVMLAGLAVLYSFPSLATGSEQPPIAARDNWEMFWAILAGIVAWRCGLAVFDPRPAVVQAAVKNSIFSLIIIDAAACFAVQDAVHVGLIIVLLVPTMFLGRFIYST